MTKEEVRAAILEILSDIAPDEDLSSIDDDKKLREQFNLDSMDFLDIVMELRKRYNLEVPEKDYEHLVTLSSCVSYLQPLLKNRQLVG
ncbi:MAG: acyl carrier protein [Nitrospinae bacterium]|nr:acyl carrier protein [Nitrospinota bacterium]MBI5428415.1 acyl carrier protein [Nitrospinota bacterium]